MAGLEGVKGQDTPAVPGRRPGSDATLDRLRAMILSGELTPGAVVSQLTLARTLGISTTPLREVIRQLQSEGLLEIEPNRRPRVTPLDVQDLHGVYAAHILFESLSVALTIPLLRDEDVAALGADLATMHALRAAGRSQEWSVVHDRFHAGMVAAAPPAMAATLSNFADRTDRYRRLSANAGAVRSPAEVDREHERLVEACAGRDGVGAAHELAGHLARTALALSASLAPEIDPRPVRLAVELVTARRQELPGRHRAQRPA